MCVDKLSAMRGPVCDVFGSMLSGHDHPQFGLIDSLLMVNLVSKYQKNLQNKYIKGFFLIL